MKLSTGELNQYAVFAAAYKAPYLYILGTVQRNEKTGKKKHFTIIFNSFSQVVNLIAQ
jgi:hypothetical protein